VNLTVERRIDAPRTQKRRQATKLAVIALAAAVSLLVAWRAEGILYHQYLASHYLWIHTVLEAACVAIAFMVFGLVWHNSVVDSNRLVFWLGSVFCLIGLLDVFHLLSYNGMPRFFTPSSPDKAIYFWLAGRLTAGIGFILWPLVTIRSVTPKIRWLSLLLWVALAWATLATVVNFDARLPAMFVAGSGLTPLKIRLEILVSGLYAVAGTLFFHRWQSRGDKMSYYLTCAMVFSCISELCFTLYINVYDTYNLLGHLYKLASYAFIYYGLFVLTIRHPYEQLLTAYERLQRTEGLALMGELSGRVLHEANNFLTTIRGCAQLGMITAKEDSGAYGRLFEQIMRSTDDLRALMAEISHLNNREVLGELDETLPLAPLDICALLEQVSLLWQAQLVGRDIGLEFNSPPCLPPVNGHSRTLRQATVNLLTNATQAMEGAGGLIGLAATHECRAGEPGLIRLRISDTGPGIPVEDRPRVFDKLFTTKPEGTGLGLPITKRIIEEVHGGRLWFETEVGRGTTFFVELPAAPVEPSPGRCCRLRRGSGHAANAPQP